MVQIGCLAKFFNPYKDEVNFARKNNFELMQIWYDNRGICMHENDAPEIETIKEYKFPTIIHAVLDINEFEEHVPKLLDILQKLDHKELIIHPICHSEEINDKTIFKLCEKVRMALDTFIPHGIAVYLENNSKKNPLFTSTEEVEIMFEKNPDLEFLLDIAHIDNYEHLKDMVKIKRPKMLHIADRHFSVIHEHLPIGQGEIDYKYIFENILQDYDGKIILEVIEDEKDIVKSKEVIESYVKK